MSTDTWVPFTVRYGLHTHLWAWGRDHRASRHSEDAGPPWGNCELDDRRRCSCPGNFGKRPCCDTLTQEDMLCDACREHCVAVDNDRVYHRLIDLYGPAPSPRQWATRQAFGPAYEPDPALRKGH